MATMRIAVVGAGGVGGYLAGKMLKAGLADVTLFARGPHLEAIRDKGLEVRDVDETFTVSPRTEPPAEGECFDAVFLAVKQYDFAAACERIAPYVGEETVIVPLANGVGHREVIEGYLPKGVVCDGCVYVISHIQAPGIIRKKSPGFYLIFGREEITVGMEQLATLLQESGLKTKLTPDARYACWKKYLFIALFATLTSYYEMPMERLYREHRDEVEALLKEIRAVANAMGVPIGDEDIAKVRQQAENLPPNSKTSMQLDFEAGKRTELETLSGYIVHAGEKLGIETPLMRRYYDALREREAASR